MKKVLPRFFLLWCLILLSGYAQPGAFAQKNFIGHSSKLTHAGVDQTGSASSQSRQSLLLNTAASGTKRSGLSHLATVIESENETEEFFSFKKHLANSNYFTTVFYFLLAGLFWLYLNKRLPVCRHSFYFSSYKWYLIFRVIRI
jgi:hypothetical protein